MIKTFAVSALCMLSLALVLATGVHLPLIA
jgi:hypothetical protein